MQQTCTRCSAVFEVMPEDLIFYDKISPVFAGKKCQIPPPRSCPQCRFQQRLSFRNERNLYHRVCDATGKKIVSIYSPDSPYIVYDQREWWGDTWDAIAYGHDFDFSKTLSSQLAQLYQKVPHVSLYNTNVENSYYTNHALNQKNCYLIFGAGNNEDCINGKFVVNCNTVIDSLLVYSCELCYEGISSERCYNCKFFLNCRGCTDSLMIEGCNSCRDCIGCFGLRSKQYCIFNQQYTKTEYEKFSKDYAVLTPQKIVFLKHQLQKLKSSLPHLYAYIYNSENCSGNNIYNSKNCFSSFDCNEAEDCKYIAFAPKTKETYDCIFCAPDGNRFCYNLCSTTNLESSMTCFFVWNGAGVYYSMDCHNSRNLFACVGMRNKQYCILNKQYSKEEYEKLTLKIVEHMQKTGEWGDYFPTEISPFAYNESIAQEYFPLSQEEILHRGWRWKKKQEPDFSGILKKIPASKLPSEIKDIPDDILNRALVCEESGRFFRIVPQELEFYRKMNIPIPSIHPDIRHQQRLKEKNSYFLWDRNCAKCSKEIQTTYSPERPEIVYCEECYLGEVY